MRRYILVVALVALTACKKDKPKEAAGSAAPMPTEGSAAATGGTMAAAGAAARPAAVTDVQVAAVEKMVVEMEGFNTDVVAAGSDCAKIAGVITARAVTMTAAQAAAEASGLNKEDAAIKAWFTANYETRLATSMAAYAVAAAKCATDKSFATAAAAIKVGATAQTNSADEATKALGEAAKALDEAGKAVDEAGKAANEAHKAATEAGKAGVEVGGKVTVEPTK